MIERLRRWLTGKLVRALERAWDWLFARSPKSDRVEAVIDRLLDWVELLLDRLLGD